MVMATEQDEVIEFRFPAVGPVMDVVTVDETAVGTTRKTAAAVATLECAIDGGGNDARFAADVQRFAVGGLQNGHNTAVTRDATDRLGRDNRPILYLRRIIGIDRAVFGQRFRGSVDDDLETIRATEPFISLR